MKAIQGSRSSTPPAATAALSASRSPATAACSQTASARPRCGAGRAQADPGSAERMARQRAGAGLRPQGRPDAAPRPTSQDRVLPGSRPAEPLDSRAEDASREGLEAQLDLGVDPVAERPLDGAGTRSLEPHDLPERHARRAEPRFDPELRAEARHGDVDVQLPHPLEEPLPARPVLGHPQRGILAGELLESLPERNALLVTPRLHQHSEHRRGDPGRLEAQLAPSFTRVSPVPVARSPPRATMSPAAAPSTCSTSLAWIRRTVSTSSVTPTGHSTASSPARSPRGGRGRR